MKKVQVLTFICIECNKSFNRSKKQAINSIKAGSNNKFCSVKCSNKHKRKGSISICASCGKSIYVGKTRLEKSKSKLNYCSISCLNKSNIFAKRKIDLTKFDWNDIQEKHNNGIRWNALPKYVGISRTLLERAVKLNYIKKIKHKRKWTESDKKRISEARLRYLNEHPETMPYLMYHSSKISYCETIFKNALDSSGITGWKYNYQNGIYCYDFAFPELKIDVEIDGGTHLLDRVKSIDKRRDTFSESQGWIVIRFTAKEVKHNVIKCINVLKKIINTKQK